jgi:predicted Zn-dependent protease
VNTTTGIVSRGAYTYHLNLMNYFNNRPYWDSTNSIGAYIANTPEYSGILDSQSLVEDTKIEDGSLQKTTKTATNEDSSPTDTKLKGDHVKLGKDPLNPSGTDSNYPHWKQKTVVGSPWYKKGYAFSTFDADGDGYVELPVVSDARQLRNNPATIKEYNPLHVQRQTIVHEMGHAVGIKNPEHPCETQNVMCIPVQNWDLSDKFSVSGMSQIIIHNK